MSKDKKWRESWQSDPNKYSCGVYTEKKVDGFNQVKMIEYQAYTESLEQAEKLAEAFEKVLSETEHPYLEQALTTWREYLEKMQG